MNEGDISPKDVSDVTVLMPIWASINNDFWEAACGLGLYVSGCLTVAVVAFSVFSAGPFQANSSLTQYTECTIRSTTFGHLNHDRVKLMEIN